MVKLTIIEIKSVLSFRIICLMEYIIVLKTVSIWYVILFSVVSIIEKVSSDLIFLIIISMIDLMQPRYI